ncbi:MAG: hypothetical protein MUQ51_02850 [Pseudomonadota bacterium]|nr:hypothetical protein [Pseudomonadota bacterium]MDO7710545.1 hypothetical protein [Pseudomonadota bacterium]
MLDQNLIHLHIVAEFEDSALIKAFGKEGVGIFLAPRAIKHNIMSNRLVIPMKIKNLSMQYPLSDES